MPSANRLWSIVLAGGNGERVRPLVERWLHRSTPKQYCTFVGRRSMLEHTLGRADRLAPPGRQLVVVASSHLPDAQQQLAARPRGSLIVQPSNRDTFAGVFLPLTYVRARDPHATIVIYPSDHFVFPEDAFVRATASAVRVAETLPHRLVLLGVPPDGLELDYGWISPGPEVDRVESRPVYAVESFLEKPDRCAAERAMARGALWNTMVIATRLQTLWQLGWRCFPEAMRLFEWLRDSIGTREEAEVLEAIYSVMPARNFSSNLLAPAASQSVVIPVEDVLWSDWGRPERIVETLRVFGKEPAFPPGILAPGRQRPAPAVTKAAAGGRTG